MLWHWVGRHRIDIREYSKKTGVKRDVTPLMKKIVASDQKWLCGICTNLLDFTYQVDHIKPLYKGGGNERSNLQALCPNCHAKKTIEDELKDKGRV